MANIPTPATMSSCVGAFCFFLRRDVEVSLQPQVLEASTNRRSFMESETLLLLLLLLLSCTCCWSCLEELAVNSTALSCQEFGSEFLLVIIAGVHLVNDTVVPIVVVGFIWKEWHCGNHNAAKSSSETRTEFVWVIFAMCYCCYVQYSSMGLYRFDVTEETNRVILRALEKVGKGKSTVRRMIRAILVVVVV